jgi:hypothetical protein
MGPLAPSPDIELAFSVSFAALLIVALDKNNANRLLRIIFQQEHFVAKLEYVSSMVDQLYG